MKKILILLIFCSVFSGCGTQKFIDSETDSELSIGDGKLYFKEKHNVLEYNSKVLLTKDTERYKPNSFRVKLPKQITYFKVLNSTEFYFVYPNNQMVFIKQYLKPKNQSKSMIEPSKDKLSTSLDYFIDNDEIDKKFKINESIVKNSKNNLLIEDERYEILLFNIKSDNVGNYKELLNTLKVLN
jgi:hypothetical protein